jgi:hypothetical protein
MQELRPMNENESDTQSQDTCWKVEVHYKDANRPLVYEHAEMTYIKGPFYCVHSGDHEYKHPIVNIWRIKEDWYSHSKPCQNNYKSMRK